MSLLQQVAPQVSKPISRKINWSCVERVNSVKKRTKYHFLFDLFASDCDKNKILQKFFNKYLQQNNILPISTVTKNTSIVNF